VSAPGFARVARRPDPAGSSSVISVVSRTGTAARVRRRLLVVTAAVSSAALLVGLPSVGRAAAAAAPAAVSA